MRDNSSVTGPPRCALLTPRGRGAVATIRFVGDCRLIDEGGEPLFRAADGRPVSGQPLGRIVYGHWGRDVKEEVVLCRYDESALDVHCHGGDAAARRILDQLQTRGCTLRTSHELLEETAGRFECEWTRAISHTTTERTAFLLLGQRTALPRAIERLIAQCRELPHAPQPARGPQTGRLRSIADGIDSLLAWANFGLHLAQPWQVVLAGRPNVGKSSLINALVGYARSIVFDQPGTTRDVVAVETALEGWPVSLADTAGMHATADKLESAGIDRARQVLEAADCRVLLVDVSRRPTDDDRRLLADWHDALIVAHKCDLPDVWGASVPAGAVPVSSLTGDGMKELAGAIVRRLVPHVPESGTAIPFSDRQVALLKDARAAADAADVDAVGSALGELIGID